MGWRTNIGPQHRLIINGVEIAVDKYVRVSVVSVEEESEIVVIHPNGERFATKRRAVAP